MRVRQMLFMISAASLLVACAGTTRSRPIQTTFPQPLPQDAQQTAAQPQEQPQSQSPATAVLPGSIQEVEVVQIKPSPEPESQTESSQPAPILPKPEPRLVATFPFLRVDAVSRFVEFDAAISSLIDPTGAGQVFYIEQIVCTQGTKEHESLIVTSVKPSHLHAALLMIGAEQGHPVYWTYPAGQTVVHEPAGDRLAIEIEYTDSEAQTRIVNPLAWVITREETQPFPSDQGHWVFAGSTERETSEGILYEADAAGTVVGLASFGSEVIAWSIPISHEEADGDLQWIADRNAMPPSNTRVTVRIRLID